MKKFFKIMSMAVVAACVCFASCGEKDKPEQPEVIKWPVSEMENAANHYALHYNGSAVVPGATVVYTATSEDRANDLVTVIFTPENKTDEALMASQEVAIVEGPESLKDVEVCGGGNCPWSGDPYRLEPGLNEEMPIAIDIHPSGHAAGTTALYRVAIADRNMNNATFIYLRINL